MKNLDDFELDTNKKVKEADDVKITSISLCTPGCITGRLMGCNGGITQNGCTIEIGIK